MYEYTIYNMDTKAEDIIYGYNLKDACRRHDLDYTRVKKLTEDYVD